MKRLSLASALTFSLMAALPTTLLATDFGPAFSAKAQTAATYTFYFPGEHALNQVLVESLRDGAPGANYQTLTSQGARDVPGLLQAVASFYLEHVNEPATTRSGLVLQFADQNLRWNEVRQLATADQVLVPEWTWANTGLNKIVLSDVDGVPTWAILAENTLSLTLTPYQFSANQFTAGDPIYRNWPVSRRIPIRDTQQLVQIVKEATGKTVTIDNPADQDTILALVREIPAFKGLMAQDPGQYFEKAARDALNPRRAARLLRSLQAQTGVQPNTTPTAQPNNTPAQPPRAPRKPGDRIGMGVALKGGTMPLWINGPSQQFFFDPLNLFVPAAGLQLRYDVGPFMGTEDVFVTLNGGANLQMVSQNAQDAGTPPQFPGIPVQNPFAAAVGIIGELGVAKRWQFGNYYVEGGLRGGTIYGILLDSGVINQFTGFPDNPYTITFGGTAVIGAGWNITEQFSVGLDTGFRYYADGFWTDSTGQPVAYPLISAWGPIIQVSAEYMF